MWLPNQLGNLNSVVFAPAFIKNYIVKPEKSFVDGYVNGDWATYDAGIKNLPKEKLPNVTYRFMDFKDSQIMFYLTDEGFDWGLIVTWESVGRPESGELNSFQTVLACRGANPDAKEAKECVYVTVYKELDHVRLNWAEEMDSYLMIGIFGPVGCKFYMGLEIFFHVCDPPPPPPPPSPGTLCTPELQSTCQYIINHYAKIMQKNHYARASGGVQIICLGGGGGQKQKILGFQY